ncbi:YfhH family protein [Salinibacillus xinjiangensis]|uniref:DUF1811 family protein n=1 Tax=Salinibacillus xinjiangensis TaxID=1229268 RepID=A0A6G1X9E8_9BACI|nr:YfhH family protein [Salinibacillus xinjiangensis]MRG87526.1 DUF1811 family protein [Salinibacillus xinjiangensis]
METRYSDYTIEQLREEVAELTEKARKAEQMGMVNEYAVYERKIVMAKAYMMDPKDFEPNEIYEILGAPGSYFKIDYMNGVFAWGIRSNKRGEKATVEGEQEALPISMLGDYITEV